MSLVRKRKKKTRKIHDGLYNGLYATAEEGLQNSWSDLGIDDVIERSEANPEFCCSSQLLPPCYYLYKKHANYIVDKILEQLNIEVEDD